MKIVMCLFARCLQKEHHLGQLIDAYVVQLIHCSQKIELKLRRWLKEA